MGLDDHIWLKITTHLPLRDFAALAATCRSEPLLSECGCCYQGLGIAKLTTGAPACRDAWKQPLARAELPAMNADRRVLAMQRESPKPAVLLPLHIHIAGAYADRITMCKDC